MSGRRAKAAGSKDGEWEDWWGHRFTKIKKSKKWVGWQVTCYRHTNPTLGQSQKCNRSRTFRGVSHVPMGSPEFEEENRKTQLILRNWCVVFLEEDTRGKHMKQPHEVQLANLKMEEEVEELVERYWLRVEYGISPPASPEADPGVDAEAESDGSSSSPSADERSNDGAPSSSSSTSPSIKPSSDSSSDKSSSDSSSGS